VAPTVFAADVLERSDFKWSLSRLTFPHALVRSCWPSSSIGLMACYRIIRIIGTDVPDNLNCPVICLASVSPRRRELLSQIGVSHIVAGADIDEAVRPGETPRAYVTRLAREKALAIRRAGSATACPMPPIPRLLSDGNIFGKPLDREHASICSESWPGERMKY